MSTTPHCETSPRRALPQPRDHQERQGPPPVCGRHTCAVRGTAVRVVPTESHCATGPSEATMVSDSRETTEYAAGSRPHRATSATERAYHTDRGIQLTVAQRETMAVEKRKGPSWHVPPRNTSAKPQLEGHRGLLLGAIHLAHQPALGCCGPCRSCRTRFRPRRLQDPACHGPAGHQAVVQGWADFTAGRPCAESSRLVRMH